MRVYIWRLIPGGSTALSPLARQFEVIKQSRQANGISLEDHRRPHVAAGAALFIGANVSPAANLSWINPAGGNYSTGSNWTGGVAPTANDFAYYELNSTYTVTVGSAGNTFAGTFQQFDRGEVTFDANAGTYNSAGPFGYGFVQMIPPAGSSVTMRLINGAILAIRWR